MKINSELVATVFPAKTTTKIKKNNSIGEYETLQLRDGKTLKYNFSSVSCLVELTTVHTDWDLISWQIFENVNKINN